MNNIAGDVLPFSQQVKKELSSAIPQCFDCSLYEIYGMLLFSKGFYEENISFTTEHKPLTDRYVDNLMQFTGAIVEIKYILGRYRQGAKIYVATIRDRDDCDNIRTRFPNDLDSSIIKNDCCKPAFLRGAFMACGSVTNPEKEYHLEFSPTTTKLADMLCKLCLDLGIILKVSKRNNSTLLYLKESEKIEDILTLMGAGHSSLSLMDVKVIKDVRNKINRKTNCETANLSKTVVASAEQIRNIKIIKSKKGLGFLSDELREVAQKRLDNPEVSLRELGRLCSPILSRSGINHRLERINNIAKDL